MMPPDLTNWYHHDLDPIALRLGDIVIPWYWLVYVGGWFWCAWITRKCEPNLPATVNKSELRGAQDAFLLWGWIALLLGARFFYIGFYNFDYYLARPDQVFALWNGGMSFHGGFLGVALSAWIISRSRQISIYTLTDPIALAIPWILMLGRLANFANGELPGRMSTVPWAVVFPAPFDGAPRHPSQLYEAAAEGLLVGLILFSQRSTLLKTSGCASLAFTGLYAAARFFVEFTREPDPQIGFIMGLTMGQWLCMAMMILAIAGIKRLSATTKPS